MGLTIITALSLLIICPNLGIEAQALYSQNSELFWIGYKFLYHYI